LILGFRVMKRFQVSVIFIDMKKFFILLCFFISGIATPVYAISSSQSGTSFDSGTPFEYEGVIGGYFYSGYADVSGGEDYTVCQIDWPGTFVDTGVPDGSIDTSDSWGDCDFSTLPSGTEIHWYLAEYESGGEVDFVSSVDWVWIYSEPEPPTATSSLPVLVAQYTYAFWLVPLSILGVIFLIRRWLS